MIQGSIVAIVTPMHEDGSLDAEALKKLLDWQAKRDLKEMYLGAWKVMSSHK
jgi:dihydrodipicolinate synthase/N-acetylneuraminate lyase